MQPPQGYDPNQENGNPSQQMDPWTRQTPAGQSGPWGQTTPQSGPWMQPPQQQGDPWAQADGQWVQRAVPGQAAYDPFARGQVPPPAQIAMDPNQPMNMPPAGAYYGPGGAQAPMPGQQAPGGQAVPEAQPADEDEEDDETAHSGGEPPRVPYRAPSTGIPGSTGKSNRLWPTILALVLIGFAAFAVIRLTSPGQAAYGYVRSGSLSALYTGDAVLVRNEMVYAEESVAQIDYVAGEGKQVERGALVATIYKAGFSTKDRTSLQNYRSQIKDYQKQLISQATADATLEYRMDAVRSWALECQRLVQQGRGDLTTVEAQLTAAMQDQQITIKQKFPNDQKLNRLYEDENTQKQRIANWTKQCAASANGLISFYTDGYEKSLNMTTYADFSPAQVRAMYNGKAPAGETAARNSTDIYRLVRQEPWVVLMLCHDVDWTPIKDRTYNLVIENFDNSILTATVSDFTRSGGELLIRLLVNDTSFLPNILYLRSCQVRIGENVNSLMVPSRAIFIQNGRKGVVLATEGGEYWTGVEVLSDDGTTAYVVPENASVLFDGVPVRLF